MSMNILVLHGPNLNLLGERPGDEPGRTLEALNRLLRERALALGLEVKIIQSNHEGVLVDTLHAERRWADGILINPGALAHTSYVLREAIQAVGKPAVEVHLDEPRTREGALRQSVLRDVCAGRVLGKGFDSYLGGLERLATGGPGGGKARRVRGAADGEAPAGKGGARGAAREAERSGARAAEGPAVERSIGSPPAGRMESAGARPEKRDVPAVKTIGRAARAAEKAAGEKSIGRKEKETAAATLTRALVRQKIADRLAGRLTPADLATWARSQWLEVQRGAPAESGHRELLEDSLQSLVLSATPGARMTDDQLVDLMTQLDG